ncbi:MAG: hypothetical protein E7349_06040 [Clostridiales bacterium]|nr:hypothetical protein [Clostridiales bacterium]
MQRLFFWAGIIVYRKNEIHGLTTTVGVWTTTVIGMACGGLWLIAIIAIFILAFIQWCLHRNIFAIRRCIL